MNGERTQRTEETQMQRHQRLTNEEYEGIGRLYYARFGRLRPGKDDPLHDSMSDENVRQFSDWIRYEALTDAIFTIIRLEQELAATEQEIADRDEEAEREQFEDEHSYEIDDANIPKAGRDL